MSSNNFRELYKGMLSELDTYIEDLNKDYYKLEKELHLRDLAVEEMWECKRKMYKYMDALDTACKELLYLSKEHEVMFMIDGKRITSLEQMKEWCFK